MSGGEDVSFLRVIFAFGVVLALMAGLGFILKYVSARGFNLSSRLSRAKRMQLVESLALDGKRRLVIARCDGREHLLLLGGQTDIVVQTNLPTPPKDL